jgi:hypothetical protein
MTDPGRIPIGRRAWIGNGRHGASLAPDGTIDWYAAGGLTAAPDLWRLLDDSGPAVRVGPVRDGSGARRRLPDSEMGYRPGTGVVQTIATGAGGRRISVLDFVPWEGGAAGGGSIFGGSAPTAGAIPAAAAGGIVRLVRALSGPVDVEIEVMGGPDRAPGGGRREVGPSGAGMRLDGLVVAAPGLFRPEPVDRDTARWRAVVHLDTDQEIAVTIGLDEPLGPGRARRLLEDTESAWRSWLARLVYAGPYRAEAERALISIRALTGPGGAPAAAGTTSLPRRVGSERSGDDRWVRLRHVTAAVTTLARAGLADDAEAAETWLRHTLATAHLPWPGWFDADGQPVPETEELSYEGWRRSQPVRFGRPTPLDLGLLGPVAVAVGASMAGPGGRLDDPGPLSAATAALAEAADRLTDSWRDPDAGRWEVERPLRCYTAGRVEAWSALSRLATRAQTANPLDLQAAVWQQEGRDIRFWLEHQAVAPDGGLRLDGTPGAADEADAALLTVAWDGPWPVRHPIVAATVDRVVERLSSGGLLYRYSDRVADEQAGPDLPDLESSLLAVRALARLDQWDEAHERMERVTGLLRAAGPGLAAETADPVSGELFGNFPATGAAVALLDAALALESGPR